MTFSDELRFHPPNDDFDWSQDPDEYQDFLNAIKKREALNAGADEIESARLEEGWCKYCASENHAQCEWVIYTGDPFNSPICTCPNQECGSRSKAAQAGTQRIGGSHAPRRPSRVPIF